MYLVCCDYLSAKKEESLARAVDQCINYVDSQLKNHNRRIHGEVVKLTGKTVETVFVYPSRW